MDLKHQVIAPTSVLKLTERYLSDKKFATAVNLSDHLMLNQESIFRQVRPKTHLTLRSKPRSNSHSL